MDNNPLILPNSSRTMVVGTSGSGKTTLAEYLLQDVVQRNIQTLIIDTKPRFRAMYELSGIHTDVSRRYKKWAKTYGAKAPGKSYVLPLENPLEELKEVWRLGGTVALAQTDDLNKWPTLMEVAKQFYESSTGKVERLVYVNEMSDFFEVKKIGGIFWLIARSGREKKVALLAETQRPVYIPKVLLTEMKRLYLFELDYVQDMKHLYELGLPTSTRAIEQPYTFFLWDKHFKTQKPSNTYYQLKLGGKV